MASNKFAIDQFYKGKVGKGSAMRSTGNKLWSYSTVIAERLPDGKVVGNITKYSVTTSKHQSQAMIRNCDYMLDNVPIGAISLIRGLLRTAAE